MLGCQDNGFQEMVSPAVDFLYSATGILALIKPGNVRVPHGLYVRYNQLIFGITWSTLLFLGGSSACYGTIPLSDLARIPGARQGAHALQTSSQHIDNTLANNRQIYRTPAQSYRSNMFY
ncbi:hypothetical protein C8J56DRAFT_900825 [Mycena floridula]|nr:hypothetical protein C8J56DRAFT_900825 [Mycena floridula]